MGKAGDDFLITATDFLHGDAFGQNQLAQGLMRRGDLSETTIKKFSQRIRSGCTRSESFTLSRVRI
jgi:hypothetical protein